jgi:hypothetical protein
MEGYGCFWIIVEILREQDNYKLSIDDIDTITMQTQCEPEYIVKFIEDCIEKFKLFRKNKKYFWSKSLLGRMKLMEEKRGKARKAAKIRWDKEKSNHTDAMRTHSERNAIKEKKKKGNNEISDLQKLDWRKM